MREFHISNTLLLRQATLVTFWLSLEIVMNIHIQLITEMPKDNIFLFISRNWSIFKRKPFTCSFILSAVAKPARHFVIQMQILILSLFTSLEIDSLYGL